MLNMKKILSILIIFAFCVGCQSEPKEVSVVCRFAGDELGVDMKQDLTLKAKDDALYQIIDAMSYTFDNVERYQEDIDLKIASYKDLEKCPDKTDKNKCSKNVTFTWKYEKPTLSTKSVINVQAAIEAKEKLSIFEELPKDNDYFSLKSTQKALEKQGYSCKTKTK